MRRALLAAALVGLVAAAASADIRSLMRAKGYSSIPAAGACETGCGGTQTPNDERSSTGPSLSGCTFPATFPCTMN